MTCPDCEYHKNRAARWRTEAYKQAGHDVIELPWVGLTYEEHFALADKAGCLSADWVNYAKSIEAKLKEKNA